MAVKPVVARAYCTAFPKPGLMTGFVVASYFAIPIRSVGEAETNRINHLGQGPGFDCEESAGCSLAHGGILDGVIAMGTVAMRNRPLHGSPCHLSMSEG